MKKIVYYVATSLDGYISGPDDDISGFSGEGNGVETYLNDLNAFEVVIMGRKTYEFGYKYGLKPGQPAYAHMEHHIFSDHMQLENKADTVHINKIDLGEIDRIREKAPTDIYLCGGGVFAGWLLDHEKIDILKVKLNPLILGQGVKMFGESTKSFQLDLLASNTYEKGLLINTYQIRY